MPSKYAHLFDGEWHALDVRTWTRGAREGFRRTLRVAAARDGLKLETHVTADGSAMHVRAFAET